MFIFGRFAPPKPQGPNPLLLIAVLAAAVFLYGIYRLTRRKRIPSSNAPANPENAPMPDSSGKDRLIVGAVGGFQARSEEVRRWWQAAGGQHAKIVWTFRIERFDAEGNRLPPIPVEMKGTAFTGFVTEGDRVRVNISAWKPGKLLSPNTFYNETTRSLVHNEDKNCFIATAAFGNPNDNCVQFLRSYRDESLYPSAIGRLLVSFYYNVSPPLASLMARSELAKRITRALLKLGIRIGRRS